MKLISLAPSQLRKGSPFFQHGMYLESAYYVLFLSRSLYLKHTAEKGEKNVAKLNLPTTLTELSS